MRSLARRTGVVVGATHALACYVGLAEVGEAWTPATTGDEADARGHTDPFDGPDGGSTDTGPGSADADGTAGRGSEVSTASSGGEVSSTTATGEPADTGDGPSEEDIEAVCMRWTDDRLDRSEGVWNGSVATCDPGDISAQGRDNALRILNLYRWLCGLPAVDHDGTRDAGAQACALIMDANNALDHEPPGDWACWTSEGAQAAGASNISTGPGVVSVDAYMIDQSSPSLLHRRWILSNGLGPVGLGSTGGASCLWVTGGTGNADAPWVAYPPPGPVPLALFDGMFGGSVDTAGWSLQSSSLDLTGSVASVDVDGTDMPVVTSDLTGGFGVGSAISFVPQGWTTQSDTTYHVTVTGLDSPIEYDVHVVDCAS